MASDSRVRSLDTATFISHELRDSSNVAVIVVSPSGKIVAANEHLRRLTGQPVSALLSTNLLALLAETNDYDTWNTASEKPQVDVRIPLKAVNGRVVILRGDIGTFVHAGNQVYQRGVFVDATAAEHLESALAQSARMEAVASLTSGIAHDFSNLLTVLVGNLYLISDGVRDREALYEKIKLTRDAAKRGVDLVRQLLAFARNEWRDTPSIDPSKVIGKIEPLLRRSIGSRIKLETNIAPDVGAVEASAGQVESAIVNLVINARDAIEQRGTIRIAAANMNVDDRDAAEYGVQRGEYVQISVQDDGRGIPEPLLGRVFEPFFTTKSEGKGTGLGLAMVRVFAVRSAGTVLLSSRVGRGTTVALLLPRSRQGTTSATTTNTMPLASLPGGKETVLVFSEDENVCHTIEQILGALGYQVLVRNEWQHCIESLRTRTAQLALIDIASDSASPGLSLLQTALKLEIRTIVIRDSVQVHHAGVATLQKPFDIAALATTVRRSLDGVHDVRRRPEP